MPRAAAESAASRLSVEQQEELDRLWRDAKAVFRRGAYQEALGAFDRVLALVPDDAHAKLYRDLCEARLRSATGFVQLSASEWAALQGRLRQEEQDQRRAAAQRKALERAVKREQQRWDDELGALERQAQREREEQIRQERAQAAEQARQQRLRREAAERAAKAARLAPPPPAQAAEAPSSAAAPETAPVPSVEAPRPPPAPSEPAAAPPPARVSAVAEVGEETVQLAPVTVAGGAPPAPDLSAAGVPPPTGAVRINANQMSVAPERKLAVAEGNVEVVFENTLLTCDRMTLFTDTKDLYAEGNVRLEEGAQVFRGDMVHYNLQNKKGRFLQGTVATPPWYQHGRSVEHIAEGILLVTPGYLTSCDHEPPHFKFSGRRAIVYAEDRLARAQNVAMFVERVPFLYLPWLAVADRQSPFFIIPGKKKPWEQFALMGYRYELPNGHDGTVRMDWRRTFGWAVGLDHQFDNTRLGNGLLKLYYNEEPYSRVKKESLPKGADHKRYRLLWRHLWEPMPDTTVLTDLQEFSDVEFRKDLLFREEFVNDDQPESFVSVVTNDPNYNLSVLVRKRMNRFQTVTEALPEASFTTRDQQIGDTNFYSTSGASLSALRTKTAHSGDNLDGVRAKWSEKLSYAMSWFRPIAVTPSVGLSQTYYTEDTSGHRDILSGQFSAGANASLKLFRLFQVTTNALGLDINRLRHVLTPTVAYSYVHQPTVPNGSLDYPSSTATTNTLTLGLENKLQTKRHVGSSPEGVEGKPLLRSVDLARVIASLPYTFHGNGNKQGGRLGDWAFDVELYPWNWLRVESNWSYPSHFVRGTRDRRLTAWSMDLVAIGGPGELKVEEAPDIQAPAIRPFELGARGALTNLLLPQGQWYLGLRHGYSYNDKTEETIQFDWRLSEKWELGTYHRVTFKEVAGGSKRFNHLREYQYTLRRDLHDWIGEVVYRVDREFGEELFFTLTLKAYPTLPIEMETAYHQPKFGSQSSPFSPLAHQHR
jgi:hypothetical protein